MNSLDFSTVLRRALALWAATSLVVQTGYAEPETPKPATSNAPAATAAASGAKEPLIEVSVDSLEISETNNNNLGILWGHTDAAGGLQTGKLNFFEETAPALLKVGSFDRQTIAATLEAMIQHSQARVLANPTLLTKSGFEATFLVGGEVPYPQVGQGGVTGVEFKKYGVSLKILPEISPRKTIEARINVGVSDIDSSVAISLPSGSGTVSIPGIRSNEAGTKVEVNDGETVVIAGIKQSRRNKTVTKVPFLGSIPLIGVLFRDTQESVVQNSLVEFVTFRLVK